jgi:hypothetical protein
LGRQQQPRRQQQKGRQKLGNTSSRRYVSSATAEIRVTAGTPFMSTAIRTTAAAGMPATADIMKTAGNQGMSNAEINFATAESLATAEASRTLWVVTSPGMLATTGMLASL